MAVITYRDITPSLIENATMKMMLRDGVDYAYNITPNEGYVLRDNRSDWIDIDPETEEEYTIPVYCRGTTSVAANYDFTANPFEFYAVLESEVPTGSGIMGGGDDTNHEVM